MDEKDKILDYIKNRPTQFRNIISNRGIDHSRVNNLVREFEHKERDLRENQVGNIQKDKVVGKGEDRRIVKSVKIPIPFQKKISTDATAFEVGEPPNITPSEDNDLGDALVNIWSKNKMNSLLINSVFQRKSQLQSAILFFFQDTSNKTNFNKIKDINGKRDLKAKLLKNKDGKMTPIFNIEGDMIFFCWEFTYKGLDGKKRRFTWIYDDENRYEIKRSLQGEVKFNGAEKHGFDRIPIAYTSQENEEWYDAQEIIDRMEVSLSKLGAANDYSGHPILKLYGEVDGAPDKNEDGKALRMSQRITQDGKQLSGDAQFLTYDHAPESVRLEMEKLEKYIHTVTSTPDNTFQNIKGLGAISGYAIELMFLDAIIKSKTENINRNQPFIERSINIILSGIITTLRRDLSTQAEDTSFDIQFNSILPRDIESSVQTYMNGVQSGIISVQTAVENLDVARDTENEINRLKNEGERDFETDEVVKED